MSRSVLFGTALAVSLAFLAPGVVEAQQANGSQILTVTPDTNAIDSSSYDRGRNISVRERPRPDYQAEGIHAGGFMIYPKVSVSGAYDDNIFAVHTGRVGDFIFNVSPEVDFQSTWSREALTGYARLSQDVYAKNSSENATQYGAGAAGKLEFGRADLTGGVDYARDVLPRAVSNNFGFSVHPLQYDYTELHAQLADDLTRVRLSVRVDDQIYDYKNGVTSTGAVVFDQDQNRNVATLTGKAELAVSPDAAFFLTAAGNWRDYELAPPVVAFTRNSTGYEVDAGANFDLTHLIRGEVQIGYLQQSYESPLFKPIEGPSARVQLEWFPTQLTTVTVLGLRTVGDSGVPNSAGYLTTNGSIQVDHELRRNVILTANAWFGYDQYNGIIRNDTRSGFGLSADWLLTRHVGVTFAYTYANQSSAGANAGPSFYDNRGSITLILQL